MIQDKIKGVGVALITPFNNFEVDYEALARMVDHVIEGGVDYIVALGSTAETATLSLKERQEVLDFIVERTAERVPIVAGMGSNNTADLVAQLRSFDLSKCVAILSVVPYYNKPSQEGIYRHYMAVAEASPVPVIVYNVPGRTGVNMTAETTLRLAHATDKIVAVKEASGDIEQMQRIIDGKPENFLVISGDDGITVELIKRGGVGVISVAANAFPETFCHCIHKAMDGDIESAEKQMAEQFTEPLTLIFREGNPTSIKVMTEAMGLTRRDVRLPLVEGSEALVADIKSAIERYDLK
ncbi:MAG: 4-hydroxy-tetrahydrodipicolinate synthase [Alistipes sp.]|jgi:4-hydroxy-tetrahydrodipicolinate synthase|nr:4-hydroxy-tetrahydrodipicolinate synthase [Alistipes sp.]MBQ5924183.1 4-hydroxy-tetrahydrodipicolinate synthase [Alistipes sp.]